MSRWSRLTGKLVDRGLGLPTEATPYDVEYDVAVAMPDGVRLLGDHYRPSDAAGPQPVVLIRSPYGRAGLSGQVFAVPYARHGFQVFVQSTRGTVGSGGQFRPFTTERADGLATVAWLREQDWCDGRVAMVGPSYLGHTQWSVAPYVDPPLECVGLNITAARITSAFYEHDTPGILNALSWTASIGRQERGGLPTVIPNPRVMLRLRSAVRGEPLQAADSAVVGAPVPFWRDFVEHATPGDPFWAEADHHTADLSAMPPVNMVTGWWDLFAADQLRDFTALRAAGVDARITMGPWRHGEPDELKEIAQQDVAWLEHHLHGGPLPHRARVHVNLQPGDRWLDLEEWPPTLSHPTPYHLRPSGGLDLEPEAGETRPDEFTYDPTDPTPTVGGPMLQPPAKQAANAAVEARHDVLTFTGRRLSHDLDLVGSVSAVVFVRTEREYADLFVRVCDVDEKGVSRNIVDGIRRLSPGHAPEADSDGIRAVDVELFPTAYRIPSGHRIRVQVSGGAFPRFARNSGTGAPFGAEVGGLTNRFEVFHDAARPSHVLLPVFD